MKKKMLSSMAVVLALSFVMSACDDGKKFDKETGFYVVSQKEFERTQERSEEIFNYLSNGHNSKDLWLLSEANRAITCYLQTRMQINQSAITWRYEPGMGMWIEYSWKSGDKYYWNEYSCCNYTEGSYPTLTVVDGYRLVETYTTYNPPG